MQARIVGGLASVFVATLLLLVIVPLSLKYKSNANTKQIMLATGLIDADDPVNMMRLSSLEEMSGEKQFLVQIKDHTVRKNVEKALGVKFGDYIPKNTYVVKGDAKQLAERAKTMTDEITFFGHMKPSYKTILNLEETLSENEPRVQLYARVVDNVDELESRMKHTLAGMDVTVTAVGANKLFVSVAADKAQDVLNTLSQQEEVHWIERKLGMEPLNHAASVIMQADGVHYAETSALGKKPFHEHGITGEGEIVGIGGKDCLFTNIRDTGIDWDMCFFNDPNNPVPFDTVSDTHRKIRGYKVIRFKDSETGAIVSGDKQDTYNGHGTHTAGSIAGKIMNTSPEFSALNQHNGMAPDAKLYFTDLSIGEDLYIPDDLNADYYPDPYNGGAKIHSSSWGCSFQGTFVCGYDCQCIWATGNNKGKLISNDYCKKAYGRPCCAVCNVYNTQAAEVDQFTWDHDDFLIIFSAGNVGHVSREHTVGCPATSKNVLSIGASQTYNDWFVAAVDKTDLTGQLRDAGFKTEADCCAYTNPDLQRQFLTRMKCCRATIKSYYSADEVKQYFNQHNLAYFSSRGPTLDDGRIKPDLVAPGYNVVSMHSDGNVNSFQCGTGSPELNNNAAMLSQRGTSMSAPLVAGAAALVRQYLRTIMNQKNPSGALVKGVLIHSSQPLTGEINLNAAGDIEPVPKTYPNGMAGFGLVSLGSVFGWDTNFVTKVFDRVDAAKEGRYCFRVTQNTGVKDLPPLRATLSWYDRPAAVSGTATLVSDLNLDILTWKYGDATSTRYPGNGNYNYDSVNTVERADAPVAQLANNLTVLVLVRAHTLGGAQNYSLVLTLPNSNSFTLTQLDSSECANVPVPYLPMDPNKIFTIIMVVSSLFTALFVTLTCSVGCYLYKKGYGEPSAESTAGRRLGSGGTIGARLVSYWNAITTWVTTQMARFRRPPVQERVTEDHVRFEDEDEQPAQLNGGRRLGSASDEPTPTNGGRRLGSASDTDQRKPSAMYYKS